MDQAQSREKLSFPAWSTLSPPRYRATSIFIRLLHASGSWRMCRRFGQPISSSRMSNVRLTSSPRIRTINPLYNEIAILLLAFDSRRFLCVGRLNACCVHQRLQTDPTFSQLYCDFMTEYKVLGTCLRMHQFRIRLISCRITESSASPARPRNYRSCSTDRCSPHQTPHSISAYFPSCNSIYRILF